MIYDRENIQISELCPIQFTEPREYEFYNMQQEYVGKIVSLDSIIQVSTSIEVYNSNSPLLLKMFGENEEILYTYQFNKCELSTGYYYAQALIDQITSTEQLVYFEITHGATILATSIWYKSKPNYVADVKDISYYNGANDWNVVFNEDLDAINLPISKESIGAGYITSIAISASEITYDVLVTCGINYDILPNFYIRFVDINGILHQELVTTDASLTYEISIPKATLLNAVLYVFVVLTDESNMFVSNHKITYKYSTSFTRENTFLFDVECGFIPKDGRDEQEAEDFIEQDMVNDTVYGDEYEVLPVTFGDGMGIPNWLRKKISRATLCDTFKIGASEYKRINGAKMEKIEDTENGLATYKIDLQTTNNYLQ